MIAMFVLFSAFVITFTTLVKAAFAALGVAMAIVLFLALALAFAWALFSSAFATTKVR